MIGARRRRRAGVRDTRLLCPATPPILGDTTVRHTRRTAIVVLVLVPALLGLAACTRFGATLTRPSDPVVLAGSAVPKLLGGDPMHVVGFAWDGSAWHQIPVQVDERDLVNPGQIYHRPTTIWPTLFGTATPYKMLVYTPPAHPTAGYTSSATYTPSDSDPTFDGNDELSFLANDTGKQAGRDRGRARRRRREHAARRSRRPTRSRRRAFGYVYLFHSDTLTGGSAGTTGVQYTFSLDSGDYRITYKMGAASLAPNNTWGFNPEHSTRGDAGRTASTSATGGSTTAWPSPGNGGRRRLLDRTHFYVTGGCGRSEDTFDGGASNPGEGAFIVQHLGSGRARSGRTSARTATSTPSTRTSSTRPRGPRHRACAATWGSPATAAPTTT